MKKILSSIFLLLILASPLFAQSADEKRLAFRTAFFAHSLTYNLDKQNVVGFHFGQLSQEINENNIDKGPNKIVNAPNNENGWVLACLKRDALSKFDSIGNILIILLNNWLVGT